MSSSPVSPVRITKAPIGSSRVSADTITDEPHTNNYTKTDLPTSTTKSEWAEVEKALYSIDPTERYRRKFIGKAKSRHITPPQALRGIEVFKSHRRIFRKTGALLYWVENWGPGEAYETGWPDDIPEPRKVTNSPTVTRNGDRWILKRRMQEAGIFTPEAFDRECRKRGIA